MPICSHRSRTQPATSWPAFAPRTIAAGLAVASAILSGTSAGAAVAIGCGPAAIAPGGVGTIPVWLRSAGVEIAGVQNDLHFSAGMHVLGDLHCAVNPAIGKEGTAFALVPWDCGPGDCSWMRAVVISLQSVAPMPDSALLYTCEVGVDTNVRPGSYPVRVVNPRAATPQGAEVQTYGVGCAVYVSTGAPHVVGAPAATPYQPSVATAAAKPAATPVVFTPARHATPRPTPTTTPQAGDSAEDSTLMPADASSEGGCQLSVARPDDNGALIVLVLAGSLALVRAWRRQVS